MESAILGAMIFGAFYGLTKLFGNLSFSRSGDLFEGVLALAAMITAVWMLVLPGMVCIYIADNMTSEFDKTVCAACLWHYFYLAIWFFEPWKERKK